MNAGETLRERLSRGALSAAEAVSVARGVLEALREAHARGVGHGAVSASTIVLQEGRATLIDFAGGSASGDLAALGAALREAIPAAPRPVQQFVERLPRAASAADALQALSAIASAPAMRFAGRTRELADLIALLAEAAEGRVAVVESEPGGGKTRLLDELARAAHGFRVLRGRTLAAAVAGAFEDAAYRQEVIARLSDERGAVAAVFPALGLGPPDAPGPEEHAQHRADRAAHALLAALGDRKLPALALLDDFAGPAPARAPHAVIVIARDPSSDALDADARFSLAPLTPEEQRIAAEPLARSPAALEAAVRRSGGNPLLLEQALLAMAESGADDTGAGELLARRLELLPADALRLLTAGAVLGDSFAPALAASLAGLERPAAALEECRRRQLVSPDFAFVHARVRQALLDRLAPEERRSLHLAAAERVSADEEKAALFDAAGESARALPHALAAADAARARFDFDGALRFLRIAGRAGPDARLLEQLAAVLTVRGRFAEAEAELGRALALVSDPRDRARLQGRIGELAFRRGDHATAAHALESALRLLGSTPPRWPLPAVALELFRRRAPDALAARLHSLLTFPYYFQRGPLFTLWTHLRELSFAERLGDSPELAQAYANHAIAVAQLPWTSRSLDFAARAVEVAQRTGDAWVEARARHMQALVLFWSCRYREALERGRDAQRRLERLGDPAESNAARFTVASCLYRLGSLAEAAALAREQHRIALSVGGAVAIAGGIELWAKASGGRVPADDVAEARRRCGEQDPVLAALLHTADGIRLLRERDLDGAVAALSRSDERLRAARFRNGLVADAPAYLAGALRMKLASLPPLATEARRSCLASARRAARRALRIARKFEKALPHALREAALIEAAAGRPGAAENLLRQSLTVAERQQARAEAARARLALADLAGDRRAADECVALLRSLGDEPDFTPAQLSLADRSAQVLTVGRALTTALSPAAVHAAARAAALELLRADSCEVLAPEAAIGASRHEASAPIVVRGATVGVLRATSRRGGFGDEEERLLGFVAALAGAALENAEGYGAARRAEREVREVSARAAKATEEERRRLALALHDGAGQTLSAAAMQLASLKDPRLDKVRALIEATLDDLRGLSRDLRPAALDRLGLVPALQELAESMPELSVELRAPPGLPPLSPDAALCLYRIAQSALANVARHARARRAAITLAHEGGRLRLCVEDDGVGFDPARLPDHAGIGLAGMRERAAWLEGSFRVESAPGTGTRVLVELPSP